LARWRRKRQKRRTDRGRMKPRDRQTNRERKRERKREMTDNRQQIAQANRKRRFKSMAVFASY
jgi:hypothetical protein